MAFKLDDIIIDRIQYGVAEDFDGHMLYALSQLSEATINISAESKDAVDAQGTLIKRFWQAKTGEFSATNAMLNLNILGAASGEGKIVASNDDPINMPKIIIVKAGTTVTLNGYDGGDIMVNAFGVNGAMGEAFTMADADGSASETQFAVADGVLTPPTAKDEDGNLIPQYIVKYNRDVASGVGIVNRADKFPQTVKLTLKALCVDPCSTDTLRACYIVLPSFQVSPEVEITFDTEGNLAYNGQLQVDYCSADKALYYIYMAEEDEEE